MASEFLPEHGAAQAQARVNPLAVTWFDRLLSLGTVAILSATVIAIVQGRDEWHLMPLNVWLHLSTIIVALALTPVMLLRRRGDRLHRRLGMLWLATMGITAVISFDIRLIIEGQFSPIHILSAVTLFAVPRIYWTARNHRVAQHRNAVRTMVLGALLIAGFFTFPFNRMLGQWLMGGPGI